MSLKAFHIFFIVCAIFLVGWCGLTQLQVFGQNRQIIPFIKAVVAFVAAAGLAVYLMWFLKKTNKGED